MARNNNPKQCYRCGDALDFSKSKYIEKVGRCVVECDTCDSNNWFDEDEVRKYQ